MFDIDFTFLWTAINLLIVYLVVKKFLFKRLGGFMEERASGIANDIKLGETLKAEGEELRLRHEALVKDTTDKQRVLLDEARKAAEQEYARIVNEAKQEAARLKAEARGDIDREREQMKRELSGDVISLALAAASRVVETSMDTEANRDLVNRLLRDSEGVA